MGMGTPIAVLTKGLAMIGCNNTDQWTLYNLGQFTNQTLSLLIHISNTTIIAIHVVGPYLLARKIRQLIKAINVWDASGRVYLTDGQGIFLILLPHELTAYWPWHIVSPMHIHQMQETKDRRIFLYSCEPSQA